MKKHLSGFVVLFFISTIISCSKTDGTPKSLEEILKRNEVYGGGGSGGGSNSNPGGGAPSAYQGSNASIVRDLLSKVSGWRTPSCANCNDGIPPTVNIGTNCIRDTYVAAAVNYAWAAESYYRLGDTSKAAAMINLMNQSLQYARNLCSSAPGVGGGNCLTFSIYPC